MYSKLINLSVIAKETEMSREDFINNVPSFKAKPDWTKK